MDVSGGEVQSTVVSLIYGAGFIGAVSPLSAGIIADSYGTTSAFIYGGGAVFLGAAALALTKLPRTTTQLART